jgi:hypothetical protein
MKALVAGSVLVACVVTFSLQAVAQEGKKPPAKEHSMTGCLQKGSTAETFVVANSTQGSEADRHRRIEGEFGPSRRPYDDHHRRGRSGEGSREPEAQTGEGGSLHEAIRHQNGRGDLQVSTLHLRRRTVRVRNPPGSSVVRPSVS